VGLGFLDGESTITLLYVMGLSTLGLMAITVVAGFAADIELHVEDEGRQVA